MRRGLDALDRWARAPAAAENLVITHGEPHPGNVIRPPADGAGLPADVGPARGGIMLIDWDTIALAPPERDLWMIVSDSGEETRRYSQATGRPIDPAALALYRIRWTLDDISAFLHMFRNRHGRTADAEHTWLGLSKTLARAAS